MFIYFLITRLSLRCKVFLRQVRHPSLYSESVCQRTPVVPWLPFICGARAQSSLHSVLPQCPSVHQYPDLSLILASTERICLFVLPTSPRTEVQNFAYHDASIISDAQYYPFLYYISVVHYNLFIAYLCRSRPHLSCRSLYLHKLN